MYMASTNLQENIPETTSEARFANKLVDDITQGVANMLQHSDEDNSEAQHFIQNLPSVVQQNQEAFTQINSNFNTLQNEIHSMNATRNNSNTNNNIAVRFGNNNFIPPSQPFVSSPIDFNQVHTQVPYVSSPGSPQIPFMSYTMPPSPYH